jgi:hypothetical protein
MISVNLLLQGLIDLLAKEQRMAADTAFLRDVVHDNRGPPPTQALTGGETVRIVGSPTVVTGTDGPKHGNNHGWAEPRKVDDWRPPGDKIFNALMDEEDRRWRAERALEQAKLGGQR